MRRLLALTFLLLGYLGVVTEAYAEKRVALVIGNANYHNAPRLPNPRNDAEDVAAALRGAGFETMLGLDLDRTAMEEHSLNFVRDAQDADVALYYYSGHALQHEGTNFLVPVDAQLRDQADLRRMIKVNDILADLQQAKNVRILVLDACRDNPLVQEMARLPANQRNLPIQRGLARIDSPRGTIVAYSTQAGRTADDGAGRNSPYTAAFLNHIGTDAEIGVMFRRISADVFEATRGTQLPELSFSLIGEYYLGSRSEQRPDARLPNQLPIPSVDPCRNAQSHWLDAQAQGTRQALETHVALFPKCPFAELAKVKIAALSRTLPEAPSVGLPAGGLFGADDMGRVRAIVAKHKFILNDFKIERVPTSVPAALRRFVGIWSSEVATGGGRGRQIMLLVSTIDQNGLAEGTWVLGRNGINGEPAVTREFFGKVANGQLTFDLGPTRVSVRFGPKESLNMAWKRDGHPVTVIVHPVWRLVEKER